MGRPGWACEWFHHRYRDGDSQSHLRLHRIGRGNLEAEGVPRSLLEQNKVRQRWLVFQKILGIMGKVYSLLKILKYSEHVEV